MPRFRSIGFMPETTYFMPSYTMDCVSTVAVLGQGRSAKAAFEHHIASSWPERHFNCIGQNIDAFDDFGAGLIAEYHFFFCQVRWPSPCPERVSRQPSQESQALMEIWFHCPDA